MLNNKVMFGSHLCLVGYKGDKLSKVLDYRFLSKPEDTVANFLVELREVRSQYAEQHSDEYDRFEIILSTSSGFVLE